MASFLSRLFGSFGAGKAESSSVSAEKAEVYNGFRLIAQPVRDGAQFRIAGRIETDADGNVLTREFIRADMFSSESEAIEFTLRKGRQIIDQMGASLFADGAATGRA